MTKLCFRAAPASIPISRLVNINRHDHVGRRQRPMFSQLKDRINNSLSQIQQQQQAQAQQQNADRSNTSRSGSPAPGTNAASASPKTGSPLRAGRTDASSSPNSSQESSSQIRHHATPSLEGVLSSVRRSLQSSKVGHSPTTPTAAETQTKAHVEAAAKESDKDPIDIIEEIEAEIQREREEDERRQREESESKDVEKSDESEEQPTEKAATPGRKDTPAEGVSSDKQIDVAPATEAAGEVTDIPSNVDTQGAAPDNQPAAAASSDQSQDPLSTSKPTSVSAMQDGSTPADPKAPTLDSSDSKDKPAVADESTQSPANEKSANTLESTSTNTAKTLSSTPPIPPAKDNPIPKATQDRLDRLSKYEKRFPELARAYKKIQAEKKAVEAVLQKSTPIESISDVDAFEGHLNNLTVRAEMSMNEIRRVTTLLDENKRQTEELREIHKMESKSQSEQIDELKAKVEGLESELQSAKTEADKKKEEFEAKLKSAEDGWKAKITAAQEEHRKRVSDLETQLKAVKDSPSASEEAVNEVPASNEAAAEVKPTEETSDSKATINSQDTKAAVAQIEPSSNGDAVTEPEIELEKPSPDAEPDAMEHDSLKIKELSEEKSRLNDELSTAKASISDLEQKVKTLENDHTSLKERHSKTSTSEAEAVAALAGVRDKLNRSEKTESDLSEQLASTRQSLIAKDAETEKIKRQLSEEEDKKNKSIQLLKGIRQKLVKSEKDREELSGQFDRLKASEHNATENLKSERARFEKDAENMRLRIVTLEGQIGTVTREKDALFEQVQIKLAEFESSQSALEALQSQTAEMSYQLREANDRCAALEDQIADNAKMYSDKADDREQAQALIRQQERASEARIKDVRSQLTEVQNERDAFEIELARLRQSQSKEAESLRMQLLALEREHADAARTQKKLTDEVETIRNSKVSVAKELAEVKDSLERAETKTRELEEALAHTRQSEESFLARNEQQNKIVKELKDKEIQLRTANKTLKDELRKAQGRSNDVRRSMDVRRTDSLSPAPSNGSPVLSKKEDDTELELVNFEYLRNVIFQFLEHKDMRPQLVQVLGIILKFTPQEIRKLTAIST